VFRGDTTLTSARFRSRSEVPRAFDRVYLVQPFPFDLRRFRPGPSGFLSHSSLAGVTQPELLSSGYRSPRSLHRPTTAPACACECASPGVPSPTALDSFGRPYVPEIPFSGTVRPQGFSPSRRIASPKSIRALFHARCAPGVSPASLTRRNLSTPTGSTLPGFLFRAFSSPATNMRAHALLSCETAGMQVR